MNAGASWRIGQLWVSAPSPFQAQPKIGRRCKPPTGTSGSGMAIAVRASSGVTVFSVIQSGISVFVMRVAYHDYNRGSN
jgi:hypothetical protein